MDEANFDNNLSGFILSVLYAACSGMEADSLSDQRTRTGDTDTITIEPNKEREEETVREEERVAILGDFRSKELKRLTGTVLQIKTEKAAKQGTRIMGKQILLKLKKQPAKRNVLPSFRLLETLKDKSLLKRLDEKKLERGKRAETHKKATIKIKKQFEEFHYPAVAILLSSYSSTEQAPSPYNEYCHQRSKSATTVFSSKQIDPGELKLDLTLLDENREEGYNLNDTTNSSIKPDYQNMTRTSHSELYTSSDIGDPSKPKLKPSFTQEIEERHETTRAQLSGSTNHKSTE
ncbi:unnamed protein product [Mytilus edulis]|uniref:Uncharacterized protein n=1 Tax=Mytilus edulis TaxID=6550 RepID=A0A8S3R9J8_MYTED|nr:unnamed protein product [Mytilus edulis]